MEWDVFYTGAILLRHIGQIHTLNVNLLIDISTVHIALSIHTCVTYIRCRFRLIRNVTTLQVNISAVLALAFLVIFYYFTGSYIMKHSNSQAFQQLYLLGVGYTIFR